MYLESILALSGSFVLKSIIKPFISSIRKIQKIFSKIFHPTMSQALMETSIPAIFVSHKRALDVVHPELALLRINNVIDRATAAKYINNAVVFFYNNKEGETIFNRGVITKVHGNKGAVRAKFERNLCPKAIGSTVFVKLYKIENRQF